MKVINTLVRWLGLRTASILWAVLLRCVLAFAICLVLSIVVWIGMMLTVDSIHGSASPAVAVAWWAILLVAISAYRWKRHELKGYFGEFLVRCTLRVWQASARRYHDVFLPTSSDLVTQIDHIVVCARGVLVIETKNWSGRIYGREGSPAWVVVLKTSRVADERDNPFRQNDTHASAAACALGDAMPVIPIVAFVGWGRIMDGPVESVSRGLSALVCRIMDQPKLFNPEQVAEAANMLEAAMLPRNAQTRARHKQSVKRARRARR